MVNADLGGSMLWVEAEEIGTYCILILKVRCSNFGPVQDSAIYLISSHFSTECC